MSSAHPSSAERRDVAARDLVLPVPGPSHLVQFYEDEAFLAAAVGDFLAAGLTVGQSLVVIATPPHRDAFVGRLGSEGFDVDVVRRRGQLTLLDARETLSAFMRGGMPDPERFDATIAPVLERSGRRSDHAVLRLYGEMVDLLWKDGNAEGAVRLEELWNELGSRYAFSLLCAYGMGGFYRSADTEHFQRICRQHTHVIPTERYTRADDGARLVEISLLQQRARALEAEIGQRKVLEGRLREALADAERAGRAKNQFLAMMSHELRTPLNAIGGHVQLIEMGVHGPLTDSQRAALQRVQRSQQHLLALINDVLNLTRIESGRVEYRLEAMAVGPLLGEVVSMLGPILSAKELACEVSVADEGLAVHADRERVHQILLNLLTNAIKFTPPGGRITLEAEACADVPAMACLLVRDTGIGIPVSELESIFEPFVQLESRPACRQEGVGLGLAISRDLARGMGGELRATSAVGVGSTFTLVLPRT